MKQRTLGGDCYRGGGGGWGGEGRGLIGFGTTWKFLKNIKKRVRAVVSGFGGGGGGEQQAKKSKKKRGVQGPTRVIWKWGKGHCCRGGGRQDLQTPDKHGHTSCEKKKKKNHKLGLKERKARKRRQLNREESEQGRERRGPL